jgi:hypothetical protein
VYLADKQPQANNSWVCFISVGGSRGFHTARYGKRGSTHLKHTYNSLPTDTAWLFPEYEFETMGLESHAGVIIERILERGTWAQLRWLFVITASGTWLIGCASTAFDCYLNVHSPCGD